MESMTMKIEMNMIIMKIEPPFPRELDIPNKKIYKNRYKNSNKILYTSLPAMKTESSHIDEIPKLTPPIPAAPCSKYLHDYIKCIYHDESCCADLYQKYKKCMSEKIQSATVKFFSPKTTC